MLDWLFITHRDQGRERLCSFEYLAGMLTSIGTYASGAGATTIGEGLAAAGTAVAEYGSTATVGSVAADVGSAALTYGVPLLTLAGGAAQVAGATQQAEAQAAEAETQARIIDEETAIEREAQAREHRKLISRNRAMAGAAGVDPFSGSPLEMELANAFEAGMTESLTQYSGDLRSNQLRRSASLQRGAIPGMILGGVGEIGSSVMGNWYNRTKGKSLVPSSYGSSSTTNRYSIAPAWKGLS